MARRDLTTLNTVTNVVADAPNMLAAAAADAASDYLQASMKADVAASYLDMQVELNEVNRQIRIDYQDNPALGKKKQAEAFTKLSERYGSKLSPLYGRDWNESVNKLKANQSIQMDNWVAKQAQANAINSAERAIENMGKLAYDAGLDGDTDLELYLKDESSVEGSVQLMESLDIIGRTEGGLAQAEEMKRKARENNLKLYISGQLENNPSAALRSLDDPIVKESFSDAAEYSKFKEAAETRALKFQDYAAKKEIIDVMKRNEGAVFTSGTMNYAEFETARKDLSPAAASLLEKMSGFKQGGGELSKQGKAQLLADTNSVFAEAVMKGTPEKFLEAQEAIFTAIENGVISRKTAAPMLKQLSDSAVGELDEFETSFLSRNTLSSDQGFEKLEDYLDDKLMKQDDIDEQEGVVKAELEFAKQERRSAAYAAYYKGLQEYVEKDDSPFESVADIHKGDTADRIRAFEYAYDKVVAQDKLFNLPRNLRSEVGFRAAEVLVNRYNEAIRKGEDTSAIINDFDNVYFQGSAARILGISNE